MNFVFYMLFPIIYIIFKYNFFTQGRVRDIASVLESQIFLNWTRSSKYVEEIDAILNFPAIGAEGGFRYYRRS